ncbi:hypothetical protein TIFTF001_018793 [Ficus carica]|uniref:Secreted protein n=1 Tax=Ficus carica TaxID=3494 RepID=A0AA88AEQ0_FICCA|nr:hypothetical protein TIFTF001_018793 [Ficus carica]
MVQLWVHLLLELLNHLSVRGLHVRFSGPHLTHFEGKGDRLPGWHLTILECTKLERCAEIFLPDNEANYQYPVSIGIQLQRGYIKPPKHPPQKGMEGQAEASPKELR